MLNVQGTWDRVALFIYHLSDGFGGWLLDFGWIGGW